MYSTKCCILGNTNVGKTSIIQKYVNKSFNLTNATLGAIFWVVNDEDNEVQIDLWDTAGQEKYNSLIPMYTRGSDIIILAFDLNDKKTFNDLLIWKSKAQQRHLNPYFVIVGNKCDLDIFRQVEEKDIKNMIHDHFNVDNTQYFLTSAKSGENIKELFEHLFKLSKSIDKKKTIFNKNVDLNKLKIIEKKNNCCY